MAEMVLSPLVDMAIRALVSTVGKKGRMILHVDEDLDALSKTLSQINDLLADAEERQVTERWVKNWLRDLKDVAYDADDVLDEIVYEALRREAQGESNKLGKTKQVCSFLPSRSCSCFGLNIKQVPFKLDITNRIKEINVKLAKIYESRQNLSLTVADGRRASEPVHQRPLNTSLLPESESEIMGRNKDGEEIIKLLLSDGKQVSVISIVGMGGLGKTTLAQLVYNHQNVKNYFEIRAWVCVSEDFDVSRLTKEIIESAIRKGCNSSSLDPMQCDLQEILSGKRFLIVLDDVWNEDKGAWERLAAPFRVGAKGSKIIVTTRGDAVSEAMNTDHPYHLKVLGDEDCLSLFLRHAFPRENPDTINSKLMKIGEELVERRCQGLPLAAKVLGGLLSSKRDLNSWESILRSQQWSSMKGGREIMNALRVSYHHLPTHNKQCFAFCSIFPKDHLFEKNNLAQLWMAQGFIKPREGTNLEEKIGSEYFDFLLSRSFFQVDQVSSYEDRIYYKMHDCIHDLAMSVSSEECFKFEHGKPTPSPIKGHRHSLFILNKNTKTEDFGHLHTCKGLRTCILDLDQEIGVHIANQVIRDLTRNLRRLRVLILKDFDLIELPDSISNLKHLRYLDLSYTEITQLPESMSSLYNLQTLILSGCSKLCQLPKETRKLVNLRHLNLNQCDSLQSMPELLSNNLQTLNLSGCKSLQSMPELLSINLQTLNLSGCRSLQSLPELQNNNLQTLDLSRCESLQSLPELLSNNLQTLNLSGCRSLQSLPELLSNNLQTLDLSRCESLQSLPKLLSNNLQALNLSRCRSLQSMPEVLSNNLQTLNLSGCRSLQSMPQLQSNNLQTLDLSRCESLQSLPELLSNNLQALNLSGCRSLQSMPELLSNNLQTLTLFGCRSLQSLPELLSNNFQTLNLSGCHSLQSLPELLSNNLQALNLSGCHSLQSMPEVLSNNLQTLNLSDCPRLTKMPNNFSSLKHLKIDGCHQLECLPKCPSLVELELRDNNENLLRSIRGLTTLSSLRIRSFKELKSLPEDMLQPLVNLKDLEIGNCDKLASFLEEYDGLPPGLRHLYMWNFHNMKSLPKGLWHLTSLEELSIVRCPQLLSLPEEGLPISLQKLRTVRCPKLRERCREGDGEDWAKISHIPHISIDWETIDWETIS